MDAFDYREPSPVPPSRDVPGLIWNILTIVVLLLTVLAAGIFLIIFTNPQVGLNPFPPDKAPFPLFAVNPTPTNTPLIVLPPTWTPEPTVEPSPTPTSRPTLTPWPSPTPFGMLEDGSTPGPSPTPGGMSFVVLQGSPKASPNIFHMDRGCGWSGVYGQVRDLSGRPLSGMIVQLGGTLGDKSFDGQATVTGLVSYNGEAGFEFELGDEPVASTGRMWVQLVDISEKIPLSEKVYFDTYDDCDKNMIVVYFVQVK